MSIAPAPDPAQLGSFVGIGVEKAEAARRGGGPAALAALGLGLAARIRIPRRHVPLAAYRRDFTVIGVTKRIAQAAVRIK